MAKKILRYSPFGGDFAGLIAIDKILHINKSEDGEITYIHLVDGTILKSNDSINTLEARLNSED